jgi:hypothetical protein
MLQRPPPPWGQFGSILLHGVTTNLANQGEPLKLKRVGPYVPAISFPGYHVVVTDQLRSSMLKAELRGVSFERALNATGGGGAALRAATGTGGSPRPQLAARKASMAPANPPSTRMRSRTLRSMEGIPDGRADAEAPPRRASAERDRR